MLFRRRGIRRKPQVFPIFQSQFFRIRKKINIWIILLLVIFVVVIQIIWAIENNLRPMLMEIAKTQVKNIAQTAMKEGIKDVQDQLGDDLTKIITVEKGNDGRITFVQVDPKVQAQIYESITESVQAELSHLQDHTIGITIGQILQSNIFSEVGPDIPVELWPEGSSKVSIIPKMEAQGINMVMVTLNVHVRTEMGMIVPFSKEEFPVEFDYPLTYAVVVGEVPEYYYYNDQGEMKQGQVHKHQPPPPTPTVPTENKKHGK